MVSLLALSVTAADAEVVSWNVDANGNWEDGSNWSTGSPPGDHDVVIIDRSSGDYVVTLHSTTAALQTLACAESLAVDGTIRVYDQITVDGSIQLGIGTVGTAGAITFQFIPGTVGTGREGLLLGTGEIVMVPDLSGAAAYRAINTPTIDDTYTVVIGPDLTVRGGDGQITQGFAYGKIRNEGTLRAEVPGKPLRLLGWSLTNTGSIEAANGGEMELWGTSTTAGLGAYSCGTGTVYFLGTIDNTGNTLAFNAVTGSPVLGNNGDGYGEGRIIGGTITGTDGQILVPNNGVLAGVTLASNLSLSVQSAWLILAGGLTLDDAIVTLGTPSINAALSFEGTQTIYGTGEIVFPDAASVNTHYIRIPVGDTLTVGSGITIHGDTGRIGQGASYGTLINHGTIRADSPGGRINLDASTWENTGTIEAVNGATLGLRGTCTTAGLGTFHGVSGTLEMGCTVLNTGASLVFDATTGSPELSSTGEIVGGTIIGTDGHMLKPRSGTLDAVALNGSITVDGTLNLANGFTLNGIATVGPAATSGSLTFQGTQTFGGTAEVIFGPGTPGSQTVAISGTGATLTIGPNVTIHGEDGQVGSSTRNAMNLGSVACDVSGGNFTLAGATWINQGTVRALGGGKVTSAAPFTQTASLAVEAASEFQANSTFTQTAGTTTVLAGGLLDADVDLQGGLLAGVGTVEGNVTNAGTVAPGASPGVLTVQGNYTQSASGRFDVEIGGTAPGEFDQVLVSGTATLEGMLDVTLVDAFLPSLGNSFPVFQAASTSGALDCLQGLETPNGLFLVPTPSATSLSLVASSTAGNSPPVLTNDSAATAWAVPLTVHPLANDTDPDGDDLHIVAVDASNILGEVSIDAGDTTVTYQAPPWFLGQEAFTYEVSDCQGFFRQATITVDVEPSVVMNEDDKLMASDATADARFGRPVDISGDRLIVGANLDGGAGAAYIFERELGTWTEAAKLVSSDLQPEDAFGVGVSVSGDYAIVGASAEDGGPGDPLRFAGAAYVFERIAGTWTEVAKLTASDADSLEAFGFRVSISGDRAIVGALREDGGPGSPLLDAGAAYIFERDAGGDWNEVAKLTASDAQVDDLFGNDVAINGNRAVVGAPHEDGGPGDPLSDAGAAYVFERSGSGSWSQVAKLMANDANTVDNFGNVDIYAGRIVVGTTDVMPGATGEAYIFERDSGGSWNQVVKLTASDAQPDDGFGIMVSISASRVLVGARDEDGGPGDPLPSAGAAYLFARDIEGNWNEVAKLTASDADSGDNFGRELAIDGVQIAVGANREDGGPGNPLPDAGAVYVYTAPFVVSADHDLGTPAAPRYSLANANPNPFNPATRIGFTLPGEERVFLTIHDVAGGRVRTLIAGERYGAGLHETRWDGRDHAGREAASGVYFYRLKTDGFVQSKRMILLK